MEGYKTTIELIMVPINDVIIYRYIHMPDAEWIAGRTAFLKSVLSDNKHQEEYKTPIYASDDVKWKCEEKAYSNMAWEMTQYMEGRKIA